MKKNFLIFLFFCMFQIIHGQENCGVIIRPEDRFGVLKDFEYFNKNRVLINETRARLKKSGTEAETITIRRHIIRAPQGVTLNPISESDWMTILDVANEKFTGTGLEFTYHAIIDTFENPNHYDIEDPQDNILINDLNANDNQLENRTSINLYIANQICVSSSECTGNGFVNSIPYSLSNSSSNHVVLANHVFGGNAYLRRTFTHELGHFFGLLHTFDSSFGKALPHDNNSIVNGDLIFDTNADLNIECYSAAADCGEEYDLPCNNLMSYHGDRNEFTVIQKDRMAYVAEKYLGFLFNANWAQVSFNTFRGGLQTSCTVPMSFQLTLKENQPHPNFEWSFPGASSVLNANTKNPTVTYADFGTYPYSYTVLDLQGTVQYTANGTFEVRNPTLGALTVPSAESFDAGQPSNWEFVNNNFDCFYFTVSSQGVQNSGKCLMLNNFAATSNLLDAFASPVYNIENKEQLKLRFNHASTMKTLGAITDTLYIYLSQDCAEPVLLRKIFDGDLITAQPRLTPFIPTNEEWTTTEIDLSQVLQSGTRTIRFSFYFMGKGGNNFFLDNIELRGQSPTATTSLTASFTRIDHRITLQWPNFASDETGYLVERALSPEGPFVPMETVNADIVTYSEIAEQPSTAYFYRVTAIGSSLQNPVSNLTFMVSPDRPSRPTNLSATLTGNDALISWNDNNSYESGTDLYFGYSPSSFTKLVSLPPNVTNFIHTDLPENTKVYYMTRAVELNFESKNSDTTNVDLTVLTTKSISKVEYSFDALSGFGNGTPLSSPNGSSVIDISTLPTGIHVLYTRAMDSDGLWSSVVSRTFFVKGFSVEDPVVTAIQYYFDSDPGFAHAPLITVGTNQVPIVQSLDLSGLTDGIHVLYLRARDDQNHWSNIFQQAFLKFNSQENDVKVVDLQYSVDNGLLIGTGTPVSIVANKKLEISFNMPGLSNGKHYISARAKDSRGLWSNISIDSFFVNDQHFCQLGANVSFSATVENGISYYWQENRGAGWIGLFNNNIYKDVNRRTLTVVAPPTSYFGYKYRCLVNGVPDQEFTIKFSNTWTGTVDNDWNNPMNWSCNVVPDEFVDVMIEAGVARYPILTVNAACRSLLIKTGAIITLNEGVLIDIKGN